MVKNWAILIGINHYEYLLPLKYAERDAYLLGDFLKKEAYFDDVFYFTDNSPNITRPGSQSISSKPEYSNLLRFIRLLTHKKNFMSATDSFWFFFSGHGKRHKQHDYLMLSNSDPGNVEKTAIPVNEVVGSLRSCGAGNIVLFLDACRDSPGDKAGEGIGIETQQGVVTFFSCSPQELSWEIDKLEHSSFTYALLEGLKMKGERNCATVKRLDNYLQERVPQINSQYNKKPQNPYTKLEPLRKYNLILLPSYISATDSKTNIFQNDIDTLKTEAYQAYQIDGNLELAYQLWHQVLEATSGRDTDAKKIIESLSKQLLLKQKESNKSTKNQGNKSGEFGEIINNQPINSAEVLRKKFERLPPQRKKVLLEVIQGCTISEVARNLNMSENAVNYNLKRIYHFFEIKNTPFDVKNGKKIVRNKFLLITLFQEYLPELIIKKRLSNATVNTVNAESEGVTDFKPVNNPKVDVDYTFEIVNSVTPLNQLITKESNNNYTPKLGDDEGYLVSTKTEPIRLLILAANPKDTSPLRLDEEVRDITEILRYSQEGIDFHVQDRWAVRFRDLRQALLDIKPHIIHFSGHGTEEGIVLEDDQGNAHLVSQEALAGLFELFKDQIVCVFLNACYTELQAKAINKNISYVIGMNQPIGDKAAIHFSRGFYEALARGRSLEFSYKIGRNAIHAEVGNEYLTPVLKWNHEQYQILKLKGILSSNTSAQVTNIYRQLNLSNILVLAANPIGTSQLRINEEVREIRNAIERVKGCSFCLENRWATRIKDFRIAMFELKPKIVHFSGHGAGKTGIVFENEQGTIQFIEPDALARIFKPFANQIKCVVINACYSEIQALALAKHIDYVIAMKQEIRDEAAIAFSTGFYRALAYQYSIEEAFDLGCSEIADKFPDTQYSLIPVLKGKKITKPLEADTTPES
ncbi:caspase family protein [Nostoc linckia FACHB-104]|nr:caspase family protein [Nostoc linckia FACHB-104]